MSWQTRLDSLCKTLNFPNSTPSLCSNYRLSKPSSYPNQWLFPPPYNYHRRS
ncbi:hypothetical protein LOK49_LG02G01847 [Camellia lanceoleosa]|uniref:Uncharacterized protein n=1 Tax=Camellia lanceoleosa TaxID=1840588 RepID=A0ACC0IQS3_9ERIC|nr:hypothetical protein LOK49_LG02G01847 [Camellia lanceoleosa]